MLCRDIQKTILILTAQFGSGHISAANAIKDALLEKESFLNIIIQNFMTIGAPKMNKPMIKIYENNTKYTPGLYNYYYYLKKSFNSRYDISTKIFTPKLIEYILDKKPDLIISTFPQAAACVDTFKEKHPEIDIPTVTVITDVVDSMEWVYPTTNMYFVPSMEIKNRFVQRGMSPEEIKVTGVPISKKFYCKEKFKLDDKCRLLLLGGGRGLFDVGDEFIYWVDSFLNDYKNKIELTIVTGSNYKLYNKLTKEKPLENITILGFVNDMYNLIKNYDLMISKPGGATLFEAIQSQTPIIAKNPKVGQEIENGKFIVDKGIGILYQDEDNLKEIFYKLSSNKFNSMIDFMQYNISEFKKTIYPQNIADYIFELIK